MSSKDLFKLLEDDGWILDRVKGSHHVFRHPKKDGIVVLPHPKKDIPKGTENSILRQAGLK
ncbi:putative RNA binding protein YcfA (HicA-like mRNA interferase family) [Flavobacterium chryseum]|uniref:type II toxin-antitoxin system HicA family toxin n=1 Tax=Flavobacterium sp. P3160 TaxID=2512113 RepID=UPI00105C6ADD|nr:type II toxin-antitoxin system HicA family toxin [Flavobacterium sp. P3160]TDO66953.1 putative RNA binding protein YcfA (HicA-like mRNA interferase family) [Flavobacterium sp. P3160]